MKLFMCLSFMVLCVLAKAQNAYVDSLGDRLKKETDTRQIVMIQQQMADWYRSNEQYQEAVDMAELSLESARKTSDNQLYIVKTYQILANIYANTDDYEQSQQYIDNALKIAEENVETLPFAYAYYAEAILRNTIYDSENAVKSLLEALSKIPDIEQEPLLASRIYYQLYAVYSEWGDDEKSYDYAQKSIEFADKSGNKNQLANSYTVLAVVYASLYYKQKEKTALDNAMLFSDKAIDLYRNFPGQVAANTYGIARMNKASYYLRYFDLQDTEIQQEIRQNVDEILNMKQLLAGSSYLIANGYGILSELARQNNDLQGAENYLMQAYLLMQAQKTPDYHTLANIVSTLSEIYAFLGDFEKAYKFQREATDYNNLLFDEKKNENTKRLEAQYQLKNKDKEVQQLKDKAETHKKQNYLLFGLIGLGITGAFFMFRSYHFNLRYSLAREKQLGAERQEAEIQLKYEQEEQARLKAEQQLMELQHQKLQDEVMANQLHLQHKNEVLQQIKEKLSGDGSVNIRQVLKEESLIDNDFEKAKFHIQELHPQFFKMLNEKSKQKLTSLDLKYCAYLYLGMNTKQIADLLNVEAKSVRMTKYRLKQKFDLDTETDLVGYLKNIAAPLLTTT
ncbi:MAG: LuxR C-terminal-related transcriptional regulator [Tannerella sp.]|jgi:tetratricopeptide (TPR) repeat protein/DNA-binding CsgD family transcriptional regulator|nr:LuxR C-terminal-related transcriptional regulator [Tannerella sp.]